MFSSQHGGIIKIQAGRKTVVMAETFTFLIQLSSALP